MSSSAASSSDRLAPLLAALALLALPACDDLRSRSNDSPAGADSREVAKRHERVAQQQRQQEQAAHHKH